MLLREYKERESQTLGRLSTAYRELQDKMNQFNDVLNANEDYGLKLDPDTEALIENMQKVIKDSRHPVLAGVRDSIQTLHKAQFVSEVRRTFNCSLQSLIDEEFDETFTKDLEDELAKR